MTNGAVLLRFSLVLASAALATVAVECGLRAAGYSYRSLEFEPASVPGYVLMTPNQEFVETWTDPPFHVRINSLGLFGEEADPARCWTLLALGDSFTYGNSYAPALGARLRERYGRGLEVINAGHGGETIDHQTIVFDERGARVQPDVVVLQFFMNDIEEIIQQGQTQRVQTPLTADFSLKQRLRQTAVYQLLHRVHLSQRWQAVRRSKDAAGQPFLEAWYRNDEFYLDPPSPRLERAWELYFEHLQRLIEKVQRTRARFMILVIPDWYQVTSTAWPPLPQRLIATFAQRRDIPIVDTLETFRRLEHRAASLYLDPDTDGHLNARGHAVVAQLLLEELTRRAWVRRCAP